jgi:hypothetical protein
MWGFFYERKFLRTAHGKKLFGVSGVVWLKSTEVSQPIFRAGLLSRLLKMICWQKKLKKNIVLFGISVYSYYIRIINQ